MYLKRRINDSVENLAKDSCMISRCLFCSCVYICVYIYITHEWSKIKAKTFGWEGWERWELRQIMIQFLFLYFIWKTISRNPIICSQLIWFAIILKKLKNIFFFFFNIRSDGSLIWKTGKIDSLINYSKIFRGKFENSIYYMIDNVVSNISRIN